MPSVLLQARLLSSGAQEELAMLAGRSDVLVSEVVRPYHLLAALCE
jgi:hypothetical protein